ncbi:MAG: CehA/McbA family metallohydrolase, partial [bacterium]
MSYSGNTTPRVAAVGRTVDVVVTLPEEIQSLLPGEAVPLRWYSRVARTHDVRFDGCLDSNGALHCALPFNYAGEYTLAVFAPDNEEPCFSQRFFAASPEFLSLTPWKGDLHIHTNESDGKEPGLTMARRACELGMDFVAITDHDRHAPSLSTADEAAQVGLPLLVIPGEEATIRGSGGHVLSLGASASVGKLSYREELDDERAALLRDFVGDRLLVPPLTPEVYHHAAWTARKIREFGGLAIMAHPFWEGSPGRYYPAPAIVQQLLRDNLLDGIELLGGSPKVEGNCLAVCFYAETIAPRGLAITGGSDAHALSNLGWFWTVAFAEELSTAAVLDALRRQRTVACFLRTPGDVSTFGPLALTEYAYFLQREFFPLHDDIRRQQAEACAAADADAATRHAADLRALYDGFWLR